MMLPCVERRSRGCWRRRRPIAGPESNRIESNIIERKRKYHLTKLRNITIQKDLGGWGIMDIRTFGKALLCKSLWRGINGDTLWSTSSRNKYMGNKDLIYWYRKGTIGYPQGSTIWLSFRKIESFFLQNLYWNIQNGRNVYIGFDHIVGIGENFIIPPNIIMAFHRKGIFTWSQIIAEW